MSKSIRIRTTPNGDDKYIKVELNQDFDLLEILSLKIKQEDVYQNFCSDYGVVAGRIVVNNGYGVPNIKVSIFVPITSEDINNKIINQLYPYEYPGEDEKNVTGIRYNLLPNTQQTFDHTPVGTFAEKKEILDDEVTLEIYDKYYKYTTTTNHAGDFIIFGVPTGEQLLHYDLDVSDIGFLSARPYEMVEQGYPKELFESPFKFKRQLNISALPQIISNNVPILVQPFWCDDISTGRIVGITRHDIALEPYNLIPTATFFGSVFSDDEKDSVNKSCRPRRKTGKLSEVITGEGKVECIRREDDGDIKTFKLSDEDIDENGNWAIQLPMNLRKVITSEFGDIIPSPDGIVGIATEADVRFRFTMDKTSNDKRLRQRGSYLVPNMTGNYNFGEFSARDVQDNGIFVINKQLSTITTGTSYSGATSNIYNYLEEFFTFRWKKVYTVKQFIGRFQKYKADEKRSFVGIKHIIKGEGVNKFPNNRFDTNINPLYFLLCTLLTLFAYLIAIVNSIIQMINGLITMLCQLKVPIGFRIRINYCLVIGIPTKTLNLGFGTFTLFNGFTLAAICNKRACCNEDCVDPSGDCSSSDCGTMQNNGKCSKRCCKCCHSTWIKPVLYIKYICILAPLMCKKCKSLCEDDYPDGHSCCRCPCIDQASKCTYPDETDCRYCNPGGGNVYNCCDNCHGCPKNRGFWVLVIDGDDSDGSGSLDNDPTGEAKKKCCNQCCIKIPLIGLKCPEDANFDTQYPTILPTPFAAKTCNATLIKTMCLTCGGQYAPMIGPWVACKLEGIAAWLGMLKFDFYNDWVNGTLYFPLIKRKYKIKKRKKKFGQIKKDKFCDFDCHHEFQGTTNSEYSVRIFYKGYGTITHVINNCEFTLTGQVPYQSNYVSDKDSTQAIAEAGAWSQVSTMIGGVNTQTGAPCVPTLQAVSSAFWTSLNVDTSVEVRFLPDEHSKPNYITTKDPITGIDTQVNVGGHSHHKNKCNQTYRHEKSEMYRDTIGCEAVNSSFPIAPDQSDTGLDIDTSTESEDDDESPSLSPCDLNSNIDQCAIGGCANSSLGVNSCSELFGGTGYLAEMCFCKSGYNHHIIKHGIIKYEDGILYYPSIMRENDWAHNDNGDWGLKGNLMFPTNICELGSSVFCDIDDTPFVMDALLPTTFQVSEESERFRRGGIGLTDQDIWKIEDKGDAGVNLRAYVDFGCQNANCINPPAIVTQSQIGIDMIDTYEIGLELGACRLLFDHDEEIREYFCKRFSSYTNHRLDIHYQRPGSHQFENYYAPYPTVYPPGYDGTDPANPIPNSLSQPFYTFVPPLSDPEEEFPFGAAINDGDPFIPGDRCGFISTTNPSTVNNFYGMSIADPGVTDLYPKYPNINTTYSEQELGGTSSWILDRGVNFATSHTPYFFYFGIVPGKTALHKVVSKYFADKINKETLAGLPGSKSASQTINNQTNYRNSIKNPFSILKSCLGERLSINKQE